MPKTAKERKDLPVWSGVVKYFPDALLEIARVSKIGNDQHNPGQPLHWAKEKSKDHLDAMLRHAIDSLTEKFDTDGGRHLAKVAWRALADLQTELEEEKNKPERKPMDEMIKSGMAALHRSNDGIKIVLKEFSNELSEEQKKEALELIAKTDKFFQENE